MKRKFLELTKQSAGDLLVTAALSAPAAGQVVLNKVVEVGDPAPGTGGLLFEALGIHPVVQALGVEDLPPRIDGSGNVTFHAFMGDDGIPDPAPTYPPTQPSGIFRTLGGGKERATVDQAGRGREEGAGEAGEVGRRPRDLGRSRHRARTRRRRQGPGSGRARRDHRPDQRDDARAGRHGCLLGLLRRLPGPDPGDLPPGSRRLLEAAPQGGTE